MMLVSVYIFLLLELLVVSYFDIKTRKISNNWSIFNVVIFILLLFFFSDIYDLSWGTFFYSICFFFVGFLLFTIKIMGGGDAKLLASLYLLIPPKLQEESFIALIYSTLLIGGGLLLYKLWIQRSAFKLAFITQDFRRIKDLLGKKFPFSPVVLLAWLVWGISHYFKLNFL